MQNVASSRGLCDSEYGVWNCTAVKGLWRNNNMLRCAPAWRRMMEPGIWCSHRRCRVLSAVVADAEGRVVSFDTRETVHNGCPG
jgi:hypothetical protein